MDRTLFTDLVRWKSSPTRKPLILNGARQVGKTWLLKHFGATCFANTVYVSLDSDETARNIFDSDYDVKRILDGLALLSGQQIVPNETLIILDEIQIAPRAITCLKYFCEDTPEYAVAAAGSLLGLAQLEGTGWPVGKVETLDLYPLTFCEFLNATDNERFVRLIIDRQYSTMALFSQKLEALLKQYYLVGGMPEAVNAFVRTGDLAQVRTIQKQILDDYRRDFAKHIPQKLWQRVVDVWESIPKHLSRENKKFVFGQIRQGARSKDYEEALTWLEQAGLITRVWHVSKPGMPLSAYTNRKAFKVFLSDVGLLGAMSELAPTAVLDESRIFTEFKGALAEQYVCQELRAACNMHPYYWSAENATAEIDFLAQTPTGAIAAIEVKAAENLQAKSLRFFADKYDVLAVRFSLSAYREEHWMTNVPLYATASAFM